MNWEGLILVYLVPFFSIVVLEWIRGVREKNIRHDIIILSIISVISLHAKLTCSVSLLWKMELSKIANGVNKSKNISKQWMLALAQGSICNNVNRGRSRRLQSWYEYRPRAAETTRSSTHREKQDRYTKQLPPQSNTELKGPELLEWMPLFSLPRGFACLWYE